MKLELKLLMCFGYEKNRSRKIGGNRSRIICRTQKKIYMLNRDCDCSVD